jgi:hypothetical protein
MPLFNRGARTQQSADNGQAPQSKKEKGGWRRPANTAFKQQRLKAWQPILTPKTVLPTLFIIGIIFAPIGGLLVWGSSLVSEITFDYTKCELLSPQPLTSNLASLTYTQIPSYSYRLRASDAKASFNPPRYAFVNTSSSPVGQQAQCIIQFDVPADLPNPVLLYYKLTNFYQNHRRYVKSLDSNQLKGKFVSSKDLNKGNCKPLAVTSDGKAIYPCGLIANSMFNDTFTPLTALNGSSPTYDFTEQGIAWPGEAKKYTNTPDYSLDQIAPPPNWALRFPNGYTNTTPPPPLHADEHFQNWMRTAGLPTFSKLWGRNNSEPLKQGTYMITVNLNFPVLPYSGTKSIVISTVSWIGGKNPFLGWAYVAAASVFVLLAIAGTARHLLKPRRLGDMSLLSWNRP